MAMMWPVTDTRSGIDFDQPGIYKLIYKAVDEEGLIKTSALTLFVSEPPRITIDSTHTNGETLQTTVGTPTTLPNASAINGRDEPIAVIDNLNSVNFNVPNDYVITYTAEDEYGFVSSFTLNVIVVGHPELTLSDGDSRWRCTTYPSG